MDIKPGDLILVRGNDGISHTIEWVTQSPYSHMAGLVKENELIEAQGLRRTGYQGLDFYAGCADVYTCDDLTDTQRALIVGSVKKYVGSRYNYWLIGWQLIRYSVGIMLDPTFKWEPIICSTLWINQGYRQAGIDPCPGIRYPSPRDVAESKIFRKIGSI